MKYITDVEERQIPECVANGHCSGCNDTEKRMILNYLEKFEPSLFTSAPVVDVFTGEEVSDADNGFSDGEYTWYASEIYYFKNYDLPLCSEFVEYVKQLERNKILSMNDPKKIMKEPTQFTILKSTI